jgi:hypothetical protein
MLHPVVDSQQTHPDRPRLRQDRRRRRKHPCPDHPVDHQEDGADQSQLPALGQFDRLDRADISLVVNDLCIAILFAIDIAWCGRRHVAEGFALGCEELLVSTPESPLVTLLSIRVDPLY